jgi:hypothetical protein
MNARSRLCRRLFATSGLAALLGAFLTFISISPKASAGWHFPWCRDCRPCAAPFAGCGEEPPCDEVGGAWYWLRSPEQEKRVVISLFNRYCIRCHGVDGRGVWDIPDVPNFTNARWQACRTDGQLARAIIEGRGSVMPPWRGTLSLEEAWAMARYVRTFVPGTETPRPDVGTPEKPAPTLPPVAPPKPPSAP